MSDIVIVDLGTGNLRSVRNALEHVADVNVCISAEPAAIANAGHLILPGQGAIGAWATQLNAEAELREAVLERLRHGPVLGMCLGLQMLYSHSEENGGTPGLGLLQGTVKHFAREHEHAHAHKSPHKIPHMGWNRVRHTRAHPLWHDIDDEQWFYFANSYFVDGAQPSEVVGECDYGNTFIAAAARDNLFATQFHPEKSQRAGLQLLKNFVNWNGA